MQKMIKAKASSRIESILGIKFWILKNILQIMMLNTLLNYEGSCTEGYIWHLSLLHIM